MNQVNQLLKSANLNAVAFEAEMQAYYAQLHNIDKKTKTACKRLCGPDPVEPVERELLAEQIQILQKARTQIVNEILEKQKLTGQLS